MVGMDHLDFLEHQDQLEHLDLEETWDHLDYLVPSDTKDTRDTVTLEVQKEKVVNQGKRENQE
jgi:hypothetical protein